MAATYKVTDVVQRERFTAGGKRVSYYDVTIETPRGSTGTKRIAASEYSKDKLKGLLDEFAAMLDLPYTL